MDGVSHTTNCRVKPSTNSVTMLGPRRALLSTPSGLGSNPPVFSLLSPEAKQRCRPAAADVRSEEKEGMSASTQQMLREWGT